MTHSYVTWRIHSYVTARRARTCIRVCLWKRERERESVCVWEREWESVCVWERERERKREFVCASVCVCACVCVCMCVCVCVCVCVTYECVMSHMNESCHIRMRHVMQNGSYLCTRNNTHRPHPIRWQNPTEYRTFTGYFPPKSPIMSGKVAGNDPQDKGFFAKNYICAYIRICAQRYGPRSKCHTKDWHRRNSDTLHTQQYAHLFVDVSMCRVDVHIVACVGCQSYVQS